MKTNPDTIKSILNWFEQAVPEPQKQNINNQFGVHFEEVGEMIHVLMDGTNMDNSCLDDNHALMEPTVQEAILADLHQAIHRFSESFKHGAFHFDMGEQARIDLLDSLCDQIVTAIGVAHMLKFDIVGALSEVDASNWSKFDPDGKPLFDERKKIIKGPHYFKARLDRFT
jgi:predicted HAD superfamily Cof-like phosphohydrolase